MRVLSELDGAYGRWRWGLAGLAIGAIGAYVFLNKFSDFFGVKSSRVALDVLDSKIASDLQSKASQAEKSMLEDLENAGLSGDQKALLIASNLLTQNYREQAALREAEDRINRALSHKNLIEAFKARKALVQAAMSPVQKTLEELDVHIATIKTDQILFFTEITKAVESQNPAQVMQLVNHLLEFHGVATIDYMREGWDSQCKHLRQTVSPKSTITALENAIVYMTQFREKIKHYYQTLFPPEPHQRLTDLSEIAKYWSNFKTLLISANLEFKAYISAVCQLASDAMISYCESKDESRLEEYKRFMESNDQDIPPEVLSKISTVFSNQP
ncbi:MAG: hypothetical protein H7A39_04865 [Chlamydiales bacterium]|nr:hypothetical protein [Chlamydiales bacterium]